MSGLSVMLDAEGLPRVDDFVSEAEAMAILMEPPASPERAWTAEEAAKHPRKKDGTFDEKPDIESPPVMTYVDTDKEIESDPGEDALMNPDKYLQGSHHEYGTDAAGVQWHVWRSGKDMTAWREQWPFMGGMRHPIERWDSKTNTWVVCNPDLWDAMDRLQVLLPETDIVVREWDPIKQEVIQAGAVEVADMMRGFETALKDWPYLSGEGWEYPGSKRTRSPYMLDKIDIGPIIGHRGDRFGQAQERTWRANSESVLRINLELLNAKGTEMLVTDANSGHHPYGCRDWSYVAIHEIGHLIHFHNKDIVNKWIEREYGEPTGNTVQGQSKTGIWYMRRGDGGSDRVPESKFPSRYAMKNGYELWAESFSRAYGGQYALDPKTGHAPDIWPLLDAMLKGEAGGFGSWTLPDTPV